MSTKESISTTTVDRLSALKIPSSVLWVIVQASRIFNRLAAATALITNNRAHHCEEILLSASALYLWAV